MTCRNSPRPGTCTGRRASVGQCLLLVLLAACAAPPAGDSTAPAGVLPANARPLAYRLDLTLDPRRDAFSGRVEIDIELDESVRQVWLHGEGLDVSRVSARLGDGRDVPANYEEMADPGVARVRFAEPVPAGALTLGLDYGAAYNRNLAGLFKVDEQGDAYVLAKSESIQARKFLPGFDEPGLKAPFTITLTVPAGYAAISNAPEIARARAGDGMERVSFATTRPMPTYLLSLAVGPFDIVDRPAIPPNEIRARPIPLRGITRRGRGGDMNYILDITPRMLALFERQFGQPYPFEKLDIVAAPQWPSGATELSAAITYREQRILVGDDPAPGARLALLRIHAHEIAHMWFGNLVTPPWWDDLWLKEGISSWTEPVILGLLEPGGGHELDAAVEAIAAMRLDSLASARAIREPILENRNIRNAYDSITYSKSLGVLHMIDRFAGPRLFREALGGYVETFADGAADSADFYAVVGERTGNAALTEVLRSFVERKGVPQLDVALRCDPQPTATVSQQRYRPLGSEIVDVPGHWTIPVCLRTDTADSQCFLLHERERSVRLQGERCPGWLHPNAAGSGYYRWKLDEARWLALTEDFAALEPGEMLSMIDSAFAAFEAGDLSAAALLRIIRASSMADARQVILAPLPFLTKYRRNYLAPGGGPAFAGFAQSLYQPVIEQTAESDDPEQQLLHTELSVFLALTAADPSTRERLLQRALAFTGFGRDRDERALGSDLYLAALTVAVQDAGAAFPAHLRQFRRELDDPLFETASASALGRIVDAEQLPFVRDLVFSGELGPREVYGLLSSALSEPALREQHWRWLVENFDAVLAKIPEQWRRRTPRLGRSFCDAGKLGELKRLFDRHGSSVAGYERNLAQTVERIRLCMALEERGRSLLGVLAQ